MAEFVIYHVEGYTIAGCFFYEHFESLEDAWAYYGKDEDWQEVNLGNVAVISGLNTLVLEVIGQNGPNLDYIEYLLLVWHYKDCLKYFLLWKKQI